MSDKGDRSIRQKGKKEAENSDMNTILAGSTVMSLTQITD